MIALVLDTHAIIWLLHADARLSKTARETIDEATAEGEQIAISSITLVEIAYLEEKERIPAGTLDGLLELLADPVSLLVEVPVHRRIIEQLRSIPRDDIPDMPDRIIAATAKMLDVPVVSRDAKIQSSSLHSIW